MKLKLLLACNIAGFAILVISGAVDGNYLTGLSRGIIGPDFKNLCLSFQFVPVLSMI